MDFWSFLRKIICDFFTSGSEKYYPVDLSHFNILGTAVGAVGIEPDSDKAIFPNVNLETSIGRDKGIKLRLPIIIPGLGSTDVAKNNWDGLAIGAERMGYSASGDLFSVV